MKMIVRNKHVISALICAALMIGCSLVFNKPEDSDTLYTMLGALAAIQVVMSFFLTPKNSPKEKTTAGE